MHHIPKSGLLPVLCLLALGVISCQGADEKPPQAKKIPVELKAHGQVRVDNYYWLNQRGDLQVIEYLKAENGYTRRWFEPYKTTEETLYKEMISRIKKDDATVPYHLNGYFYYTRYSENEEYPVYCRKKGSLSAPEEIMLDVNDLARGHKYYAVLELAVSPDSRYLVYSVDTLSRRKYSLHFRDLKTGRDFKDQVPLTNGGAVWAADNKTVFYTQIDDETLRSYLVRRHTLGTPASSDPVIYKENDPTFETVVYKSKSEQYIFIASFSYITCEYRILEANRPEGKFRLFTPRIKGVDFEIEHYHDRFFIRTNYHAANFRMMQTPVSHTSIELWKELVPGSDSVFLESFEVFNDYLVLVQRVNGLVRICTMTYNSPQVKKIIRFDDPTYSASLSTNPELNTPWLRYNYSSLTTPASVIDYNMATGERRLMKQDVILGNFHSSDYISERLYVKADDGAMIPVSLVYRRDKKQKIMPMLLYGYGAYGNSTDADFNSVRLSLLDRGFIFAIAHVRGGEEMGREWYENGKMLHKRNTFTDFIRCAEYLIQQGYTDPEHLYAEGRSAGGLLIGAVVNMRPDLFHGVIAGVPFVDVVTTMLDENLPLTTAEYDEWGDPRIRKYYDYMISYSPYDNIKPQAYPAMLVSAGLYDSQVQYWEPAKWVAKLRATKTDSNPLLLYCNMDAGHHGSSGRFERFRQTAMEYTFLFKLAGIIR